MKRSGAIVIALGATIGLALSIYNYFIPVGFFSPYSNIAGTLGAMLVIGSTLIMLIAGLILATLPRSRFLVAFLVLGCLVDILGTSWAAWLLDSTPLLVAMAICAVGWLMWVFGKRLVRSDARAFS